MIGRRILFAAAFGLWCASACAALAETPLDATSANARYRLSASPALLIDSADPVSARAFLALMGADEGGLGAKPWSDLAAGAVQLRRETGETGQTLWYNPVFDTAFYVAWRHDADGWVATDAALILGETLRNTVISPSAGWMAWMRSDLPAAELEALARETIAAANATPNWSTLAIARDAQRTLALVRVDRAATGLQRLSRNAIANALDQIVRAGEADGPVQGALDRAGVRAYQTLRPVGAWEGQSGSTLALQAPDAPALTIFVQIPANGGAYRWASAFALASAPEATP